jgi:hypothetical protein
MKKKDREEKNKKEKCTSDGCKIETDPLGMWTGVPQDPNDEPVQDADDL